MDDTAARRLAQCRTAAGPTSEECLRACCFYSGREAYTEALRPRRTRPQETPPAVEHLPDRGPPRSGRVTSAANATLAIARRFASHQISRNDCQSSRAESVLVTTQPRIWR